MYETVIASTITGILALLGNLIISYFSNNKTKALILYRLDQIEDKQDKHNKIIERTYINEENIAILENKMKVSEHRIKDLERGLGHG